jgi:Uma2 family endonuclease
VVLPRPNYIPEADYLRLDDNSEIRYEYANGQIYAMAGALRVHNRVNSNIHIRLGAQILGGGYEIFQSDMRVQVQSAGAYRYPDIVIACGDLQFREENTERTLLNPTILMEILSPTTEQIDQIQKRNEYKQIPSLQEYLIVFTNQPRIERYLRQDDTSWIHSEFNGLGSELKLPPINAVLKLSQVYELVDFNTPKS